MSQAIPEAVQQLLAVFSTKLADVRFPDVDRASLARAIDEAHTAAIAVATAETTLEAARTAQREQHEELLRRAQRALAYARVFAEGDEELSHELDAILLPRATRRRTEEPALSPTEAAPARRRGRPRKDAGSGELPLELPVAAE